MNKLVPEGCYVHVDDLQKKYGVKFLIALRKKLTIKLLDPITKVRQIIKMYRLVKVDGENYIVIPRVFALKMENKGLLSFKNFLHQGYRVEFDLYCKDYDYQLTIHDLILEKISSPLILKLRAGRGKTYIAGRLIQSLSKKTLFIVPNKAVSNTLKEPLENMFPHNKIGVYNSDTKIDGDIVIMVINSVLSEWFTFRYKVPNKRKYEVIKYNNQDYLSQFGFVIYDEVHRYVCTKFKLAFSKAQSRYVIGMTATPEDAEDKLPIATNWIGDIFDADALDIFQNEKDIKFNCKAKLLYYNGPDEYTDDIINPNTEMLDSHQMEEQFLKDPNRNKLIANCIKELVNDGHYVFVFINRRVHLPLIIKNLANLGFINMTPEFERKVDKSIENKIVQSNLQTVGIHGLLGQSTWEDQLNTAKNARVIITTYSFASTGVSIPKMTAAIFASSRRKGIKQTIARIMRTGGNVEKERVIVDIIDNMTRIKNRFSSRRKVYNHYNYKLEKSTIDYQDLV